MALKLREVDPFSLIFAVFATYCRILTQKIAQRFVIIYVKANYKLTQPLIDFRFNHTYCHEIVDKIQDVAQYRYS